MLNLLTFTTLVQRFAAQARTSAGVALNFTVGSMWRAVAEANAAIGLWMQWLILEVLARSRLATSRGADVDTWVQDFGMTRLPAVGAAGIVRFSRATAGVAAYIPLGSTVRTTDGTQSFVTTVAGAIGAGGLITDVPVQTVAPGAAGNVQAGAVSVLTTAIAGVDFVTNLAPFAGGFDAESDAALRDRFVLFVDSRSKGTESAIRYAVASLRQGLSVSIAENQSPDGTQRYGFFTVTLNDGTGAPSADLLARASLAIEAVRAVGVQFVVLAPTVVTATVSMIISAGPGYRKADLIGPVAGALLGYIDGIGIGAVLPYTRLAQVAYSVPGVVNVQAVLLNGATADLGGGVSQAVRATAGGIAVS